MDGALRRGRGMDLLLVLHEISLCFAVFPCGVSISLMRSAGTTAATTYIRQFEFAGPLQISAFAR